MNIINITNFIRADDYRATEDILKQAVIEQMALARRYKMPVTFLFQHNALMKADYVELIDRAEYIEIGLWLELDKSLIERAGCKWKGEPQRKWEWYSHIDLTAGYTPEERIRIVDIAMSDFRNVFGYYPKTVASWVLDAVSLAHLESKYNIEASMNCKDQWLTDGYSLWGGYYNQAFYPCRNNAFCPAQSSGQQINVPVFRMLGSDPIGQYSCENGGVNGQSVKSLEPVYNKSGGSKEWVEWFFEQMLKYNSLSFGYAQAGQENAFGWDRMKYGYEMQMEMLYRLSKEEKIKLMKVSEAGKWYKDNYMTTPVSVMEADNSDGEHVLWYNSKYYRLYLYTDGNEVYIKDIMIFDENYKERYLSDICKGKDIFYDNLPLVDNFRWSENGQKSGLFFYEKGIILNGNAGFTTVTTGASAIDVTVKVGGREIKIALNEDEIIIAGCDIKWLFGNNKYSKIDFEESGIMLEYNGFKRRIAVVAATESGNSVLKSINGSIRLKLSEI